MSPPSGGGEPLQRVLDAAENASPLQAVEAVTRELKTALGAVAVSFLIADFSGRGLVRLESGSADDGTGALSGSRPGRVSPALLPFDGGPQERAVRTQAVQVVAPEQSSSKGAPASGQWLVLAPVTERGESLGLLEMFLPFAPDALVLAEIARVAHVLAFVVIANSRHTDLFELGQRQLAFSLPAEIQRRLLPPSFTCEASAFTLAGWLEPAAHIGGDTFDYSLGHDDLHLSVTDAMGHGVTSALIATLCVGSLRNTRRQRLGLLEQAAEANAAIGNQGPTLSGGFASGLLGRVDLQTGVISLVNAGHVPPFLLRAGAVSIVDVPADLPLGMFDGSTYRSTELTLLKGDRLVFMTDGMIERGASNLDLVSAIKETSDQHPREATRFLADSALQVSGGELADDATLLLLDWHGGHSLTRVTDAGADVEKSD